MAVRVGRQAGALLGRDEEVLFVEEQGLFVVW